MVTGRGWSGIALETTVSDSEKAPQPWRLCALTYIKYVFPVVKPVITGSRFKVYCPVYP